MTKEITKKEFNYKQIATIEERKFLLKSAIEGRKLLKQTAESAWLLGKLLSEVKPVLQHGQFRDWIDAELGVSYGAAKHFANTYEHFKSEIISHLAVAPTVVYMLSAPSVSDETRNEAIEAIQKGELKTVAETKQLIEKSKPPKPPKMTADPVSDDSNDTDPYEDVGAEELDGFGRPVKVTTEVINPDLPEEPQPKSTLKELSQEQENELPDSLWLTMLPLHQKLIDEKIDARLFTEAALNWRKMRKLYTALRREVKANVNGAAPDAYSSRMRLSVSINHPKDWTFSRGAAGGFIL